MTHRGERCVAAKGPALLAGCGPYALESGLLAFRWASTAMMISELAERRFRSARALMALSISGVQRALRLIGAFRPVAGRPRFFAMTENIIEPQAGGYELCP